MRGAVRAMDEGPCPSRSLPGADGPRPLDFFRKEPPLVRFNLFRWGLFSKKIGFQGSVTLDRGCGGAAPPCHRAQDFPS